MSSRPMGNLITLCMHSPCFIRPESPDDIEAISKVIILAFEGKPYAAGDEAELVLRLRDLGDLAASLVAVCEGEVVGQICFSRAELEGRFCGWYALGPISVLPIYQGQGVGSALMREGLQRIADLGGEGCVLVGDPRYYCRFGFVVAPAHCPDHEPAQYFQVKQIGGKNPVGKFSFHPAFTS